MKKTILSILASSVLAFSCTASAQKLSDNDIKPTTEKHLAGQSFRGISVGSQFQVEITKSDTHSLETTVPQFAAEFLNVVLNNGVVEITFDNDYNKVRNNRYNQNLLFKNKAKFLVKITTAQLNYIRASGQSSIAINSEFSEKELKIRASGQSSVKNVKFNITEELDITCSGQSSVRNIQTTGTHNVNVDCSGQSHTSVTSGNLLELELESSGQSSVKFTASNIEETQIDCSGQSHSELNTRNVDQITVECSGQSSVKVHSDTIQEADLNASGSSNVTINGDVKSVQKSKSGFSSINVNK